MTVALYIILTNAVMIPVAVWFGIQVGMEREKASRFNRIRSYSLQEMIDNEPSSELRR